jgi:ribonuclease HII
VAGRQAQLLAWDWQCSDGGARLLAGVDEAGRGSWAGPVVAAAVMLPAGWCPDGLDDSKRVKPAARDDLYRVLRGRALAWAACAVGPRVIEGRNILAATMLAMARAVTRLRPAPDLVLVDGLQIPSLPCAAHALIRGDATSAAVAAASIIAKVLRDRVMLAWDRRYPGYGFAAHKGYGSAQHREALARLGPCPLHRQTYRPVAACRQIELGNEFC